MRCSHSRSKVWLVTLLLPLMIAACSERCGRKPGQDSTCLPTSYDEGVLTAWPDSGQAAPEVVVPIGSNVILSGVARHVSIDRQCHVTTNNLEAHWQISYRAPGTVPVDVTSELRQVDASAVVPESKPRNCGDGFARCDSTGTYQASFYAQPGTYYATLNTTSGGITRKIMSGDCAAGDWLNIGPEVDTAVCAQNGVCSTGRVNGIAFDPDDESRIYVGTGGGGVWRSDDFGGHWNPMTDNKGFPAQLVMSSLAVAPKQGKQTYGRVYAGIGQDGYGSSFIPSVYLSDDGGKSWRLPQGCAGDPQTEIPRGPVTRILVDEVIPTTVYAATWAGVYVSNNAGECWKKVTGDLLAKAQGTILGNMFAIDIAVLHDNQTPVLYAAISASGSPTICDAVRTLSSPASVAAQTQAALNANPPKWQPSGNPQTCGNLSSLSFISHMEFAKSRRLVARLPVTWRDVLYVVVPQEDEIPIYVNEPDSMGSRSWSSRTSPTNDGCPTAQGGDNWCGGFCRYGQMLAIGADPESDGELLVGTTRQIMRSRDGGQTWNTFHYRTWGKRNEASGGWHDDVHAIRFHKKAGGNYAFAGNDGGVFAIRMDIQSADAGGCGSPEPVWKDCNVAFNCWTVLNNGMSTDLFYRGTLRLSSAKNFEGGSCGGLQDNNNRVRLSGLSWRINDVGGDGGYCAIDSTNPDVVYGNSYSFGDSGEAKNIARYSIATGPDTSGGPGSGGRLWSHPAGWLFATKDGHPNGGTQQLYVADDARTATKEASWRCNDPTPNDPADKLIKLVFTTSGVAYALTNNGGKTGVYQYSPGIYNPVGDCNNNSTVKNLSVVISPGNGLGLIHDLVFDPEAPNDRIYIALTPMSGQATDRIMHVARSGNGNWVTTSIASSAAQFAALSNPWPGPIVNNWRIAMPWNSPDTLYVGTDNGLFIGKRKGADDTTWTWTQSNALPTTTISSLEVGGGQNVTKDIVRAATYGRSVWEAQRCPPALGLSEPLKIEPPIPNFFWTPYDRTSIPVDYAYDGRFGPEADISLRLIDGEQISPHFVTETIRVGVGTGRVLLSVAYAGASAPPFLRTTGLLARLTSIDGRPIVESRRPLVTDFRKSDLRTLKIAGVRVADDGFAALEVPFESSGDSRNGPAEFQSLRAFTAGSNARVTVPREITTPDGVMVFSGWLQPGAADGSRPVRMQTEATAPVATVTMDSDVILQPLYVPQKLLSNSERR